RAYAAVRSEPLRLVLCVLLFTARLLSVGAFDLLFSCLDAPARPGSHSLSLHDALPISSSPNLSREFKLIWPVQMFWKKEIACDVGQIGWRVPPVLPHLTRGASRTSRCVGVGCDGRDVVQRAGHADVRHVADGEVAGSWPPDAEVRARRQARFVATVANKPGHRGACV